MTCGHLLFPGKLNGWLATRVRVKQIRVSWFLKCWIILISTSWISFFERRSFFKFVSIKERLPIQQFSSLRIQLNCCADPYYSNEDFSFLICSLLPACFSRASANLRPGRGFARIGCSPDETCGTLL